MAGLCLVQHAAAEDAFHGLLYVSQHSSGNHVYELPYTYDGISFSLGAAREIADLPSAAGLALVDQGSSLIVGGQGGLCGGCA